MEIKVKGTLIEVGKYYDSSVITLRPEVESENGILSNMQIAVSDDDAKRIAVHLYDPVVLTITVVSKEGDHGQTNAVD